MGTMTRAILLPLPQEKENVMKRLAQLCLTLLCLSFVVAIAGCASNKDSSSAAKPSYFEDQNQSVTATVEAIDPSTRVITLRGVESGKVRTFRVDDEVRNLDQVKVGDRVNVDYYESLAIHVLPPGEAINDVRTASDRAEPGEKPG